MFEYFIIALSFSIASLFFIHKKGLKDNGISKYSKTYDIAWLVLSFVMFPIVLISWLMIVNYVDIYGRILAESINKKVT